ncbi:MAG: pantoate--beta-alanine ligase, partial [Candidatus Omnitrophota bacterium]
FRGVATVVAKLFNIVAPDRAYFGQKDAQQVAVVKAMVRDLNMDVSITVMPIIREPDGLAMSSRNRYLTVRERRDAALLSAALRKARMTFDAGERSSAKLLRVIKAIIERSDLARIEYLEIVEVPTLRPVARVRGQALIAVAVRIGSTRLIDNAILTAR